MDYTKEELAEAARALGSTLGKCEKAWEKLREGTPQHTLTKRRIAALKIAIDLISEKQEAMRFTP